MNKASLAGKHILVTRAKEQAKVLSQRIREAGGIPIEVPLLAFQRPQNQEVIPEVISRLAEFDWLVFTSANGVRFFMEHFQDNTKNKNVRLPKIAVVGIETAKVLHLYKVKADVSPDVYVAESLIDCLKENTEPGQRILLARGNLGRSILNDNLLTYGLEVTDLIVYETVLPKEAIIEMKTLLDKSMIPDVVTFTSSSTVQHFIQLLQKINQSERFNPVMACIGPVTAQTAKKLGLSVEIIPKTYTVEGLVQAICTYIEEENLK
ncbi:uroporphyrinogen-III synthase [Bacillus solitudinis]|uniref:uroporphyrinogen-III synthase n=1 Tax=Bacillus solitudinis TaxID=2014074 RepID=UPI000C24CCB6|nr:uroporphyrinogen-III synthase [Bacillus solitudinis]